MDTHERLDSAAAKFGQRMAENVVAHVERAVALERDRFDSEIAGIARALDAITGRIDVLEESWMHYRPDTFANTATTTARRCEVHHVAYGRCELLVGHLGPHRTADERF